MKEWVRDGLFRLRITVGECFTIIMPTYFLILICYSTHFQQHHLALPSIIPYFQTPHPPQVSNRYSSTTISNLTFT